MFLFNYINIILSIKLIYFYFFIKGLRRSFRSFLISFKESLLCFFLRTMDLCLNILPNTVKTPVAINVLIPNGAINPINGCKEPPFCCFLAVF